MLNLICLIVVSLYVWFDTDAFVEWMKFFRFSFFKYKEFDAIRNSDVGRVMVKTYTDFLAFQYGGNFFIKIVSCSLCLAVWLAILGALVFQMFCSIGPIILFSWLGYFGLKWCIKRCNE